MAKLDLWEVMKDLAKHEVSCGVEFMPVDHFEVWIGDRYNGREEVSQQFTMKQMSAAALWLKVKGREYYPKHGKV